MLKKLLILIIAKILVLNFPAFSSDLKETEIITKSFKFSETSGEQKLVIENLNGSISVVGKKMSTIELKVNKEIRAKSPTAVEDCKKEVTLKINEQGNMVELIVDGPFRNEKGEINNRGYDFYGYEVTCNFEVEVPLNTVLWLKTINDGDIFIKNTAGRYDIENINGGIVMEDIDGSGKVHALNGDVKVAFVKNPQEDSYYGSLNGEIKLYFTKNLAADFRVKTFNGEIFSDFEFTSLPAKPFVEKTTSKKKVYKSDKTQGVRIGKGGPEITIDAFNGDAFILAK